MTFNRKAFDLVTFPADNKNLRYEVAIVRVCTADAVRDGRDRMNLGSLSPLPPSLSAALRAETDGENRAPSHGTGE